MTRGIIRGAPRAELRAAVLATLNPELLTVAEVTEEAAAELCGEAGRIFRRRLRDALVAFAEPRGLKVGQWEHPMGPWQLARWAMAVNVCPENATRLMITVDELETDMVPACLMRLRIDLPQDVNCLIWVRAQL